MTWSLIASGNVGVHIYLGGSSRGGETRLGNIHFDDNAKHEPQRRNTCTKHHLSLPHYHIEPLNPPHLQRCLTNTYTTSPRTHTRQKGRPSPSRPSRLNRARCNYNPNAPHPHPARPRPRTHRSGTPPLTPSRTPRPLSPSNFPRSTAPSRPLCYKDVDRPAAPSLRWTASVAHRRRLLGATGR